ncbi:hypothetical protein C8Q75DRAFT_723822, partial [Abortiporus biennis]
LKENYMQNVKFSVRQILCHPSCPDVPEDIWNDILKSNYVDFNKILLALFTLEGDPKPSFEIRELKLSSSQTKPTRHIKSHGEWVLVWFKYQSAVSFAFPHRLQELQDYFTHINSNFSALPDASYKVVNYDRAIRSLVGRSNQYLLTDFSCFNYLYTMHIISSLRGNSLSSTSSLMNNKYRFGSSNEICRRYNDERCNNTNCRYQHICFGCKSHEHPYKICSQKAECRGNFQERRK